MSGAATTGASFTAVTVTSKVSFVVAVPSLTVTVIVTGPPNWFSAGVRVGGDRRNLQRAHPHYGRRWERRVRIAATARHRHRAVHAAHV